LIGSNNFNYIGRFAPSPTGPLHFGSLVAAVGSYLDARSQGGRWLVRMEDVDTPRCVPGAADDILRTLEWFGFEWDGPVLVQSQRLGAYRAALDDLCRRGLAYPCSCSRKEIADSGAGTAIDGGRVYPGFCREGLRHTVRHEGASRQLAWRLKVDAVPIVFTDRLQGVQSQSLGQAVGDFVLRRADGLFAYQLAVVVDDAWQGVTDVVRGADLLASTARQIWLQQGLDLPTPRYAHLPLVVNSLGEKLSKQTLAPALLPARAAEQLVEALRFLGQAVPNDLAESGLAAVWDWALAHFSASTIASQSNQQTN
jgi:glutamyl-Q tRNA(Asp) synthetase